MNIYINIELYRFNSSHKIIKNERDYNKICNSCQKVGIDYILLIKGHQESHSHGRENYYYQDVEYQCCKDCYDNRKVYTDYNLHDYKYEQIRTEKY